MGSGRYCQGKTNSWKTPIFAALHWLIRWKYAGNGVFERAIVSAGHCPFSDVDGRNIGRLSICCELFLTPGSLRRDRMRVESQVRRAQRREPVQRAGEVP